MIGTKKCGSDHYEILPENNTFEILVVDLTHRCNMECANCYLPNREIPDLDVERFYDVLSKLPRRTHIRLIGGEPTLRNDLPDIIRKIVSFRHKPFLLTNGLKLAHTDYCRKLWDAGLRYVYISMNGADDDDVYRVLDGGKYANLKTRALTNAFRTGFAIDTGTIIARGVNEHSIQRQVEVVLACAEQASIEFETMRPWCRISPLLRVKSVGAIGRYMENSGYSLGELANLTAEAINADVKTILANPVKSGSNRVQQQTIANGNSALVPFDSRLGRILIRLVDWTVDEDGIPDAGNRRRGRLTKDFKIAPFFEDVKLNEFTY